ncbi:hypothetical protein JCM8202v2_000385 [Rhodotorula sphaerocarpa]
MAEGHEIHAPDADSGPPFIRDQDFDDDGESVASHCASELSAPDLSVSPPTPSTVTTPPFSSSTVPTTPTPNAHATVAPPPNAEASASRLADVGLTLNSITPKLALSRHGQPLCGAVLDGRFLLIGTTTGLDFLPLPLKGSLPVQHHGLKKRRETRKPLTLIKRCRFREIVLLAERSNVLVAVAGRNDYVRVYALDGIRAMIAKRLHEVDPLQGYPLAVPVASEKSKGKQLRRDTAIPNGDPRSAAERASDACWCPEPDVEPSHAGLRSPTRAQARAAHPVQSVPTMPPTAGDEDARMRPSNRRLLQQKSREFVAVRRRTSMVSIRRRASRQSLDMSSSSVSRRSSLRSDASTGGLSRVLEPRAPLRPLNLTERTPTAALADFLRESGPGIGSPDLDELFAPPLSPVPPVDENRDPTRLQAPSIARHGRVASHSALAPGSTPRVPHSPPPSTELAELLYGAGPSRPSSAAVAPPSPANSQETSGSSRATTRLPCEDERSDVPTPRARKRWTFNGIASPAQTSFQNTQRPGVDTGAHPSGLPPSPTRPRDFPSAEEIQAGSGPSRLPDARSARREASDLKRRSITSLRSLLEVGSGMRAEEDAERHPASAASPLEFLKLARSRNARLLKAVETRKRTYLAILGGEDGDRIELYTGSKNISLSLNRTFVLPDAPRTIELQLQGDELVDIYLVYADSIFALEPGTVRVREVGIGREGRRARRRREREADAARHSDQAPDGGAATETTREDAESNIAQPPAYVQPLPVSPSSADQPGDGPNDYTAFQQLPFIPPFPSRILASSWTIPPLYSDVVADQETEFSTPDGLLSPISLLGGAALRNNGPPGLFFCSKGSGATFIVTADGKSVVKAPLIWSSSGDSSSGDEDDFARHRLETLVLAGRQTVVVRAGQRAIEVVPVGNAGDKFPPSIVLPSRPFATTAHLATHVAGEQVFYSEATPASYTIKCLSGRPGMPL